MKKTNYLKYILLLFIFGCSPKYTNLGWEYFYNQDFNKSIEFFNTGLENDPQNYDAIKGIGLSYLMLNNYESANTYIQKAISMNSTDPENIFSLALYNSLTNNPETSISYFNQFLAISKNSELNDEANKLLVYEKRKLFKNEFKSALENENKIGPTLPPKNSIAVIPFKNIGEHGDYDVLEKGLADQTITYLGYVDRLKVLERLRIEELFKEINLSESAIMDKSTAARTGKLLRAEKLITGNYNITSDNKLTIKMYSISVNNGQVSEEISGSGTVDNFFEVHKETVLKALSKMNIIIDDETRKKILTFKTENMMEFIAALKKKYFEESGTVVISNWLTNRFEMMNRAPVLEIVNISQISLKPEIKETIMPIESPDLETPPALPK